MKRGFYFDKEIKECKIDGCDRCQTPNKCLSCKPTY